MVRQLAAMLLATGAVAVLARYVMKMDWENAVAFAVVIALYLLVMHWLTQWSRRVKQRAEQHPERVGARASRAR